MRDDRLPTGPETPAHLLDYEPVKRELGRLAYEFFRKAPHPIPYTDGIIFELTGYDHGEHVIAVQVVPVVDDGHDVTAQFAGPDEKTTGWAIYDRLADGTARWFSDRYTEERAMAAGVNRAAGLGVAIEPQPWRVAK
jgi:hypothetical protein